MDPPRTLRSAGPADRRAASEFVVRGAALAFAVAALGWVATPSARAAAPAAAPEPPLHIAADNMSGTHGPEGDVVLLRGHVRIVRGATVITSETGTYQRAQGLLDLDGNVTIVDSTTTITCDQATYSEHEDLVHLNGHVKAADPNGTLEAPTATYDRRAGRADLFGGVTGHYRRQRMLSDRAAYFRDSTVVQARGNVRGYDDENHLTLLAPSVDYHRVTDQALATGYPVLEARDEDGRVTRIRSRVLKLDTRTRIAEAIDSVRVVRDTLQASGDYGLFDDASERGWLLGSPKAWDDETTVTGDTLELRTVKREIERVVVHHNARLEYRGNRPQSRGENSTLTGERVDVFFTRQAIDSLVSTGGARDEYRAVAEKGKTPESNVAQGDTIRVYMRDRKIDEARVVGKARGEYQLGVAVTDTASAKLERVAYDAATIRYLLPTSKIVLDGAAHVTYRDLDLKARRVTFDSDHQTLVADGKPELVDHGDKVNGNQMTYDLESRVGNIYQAQTSYEKGLYTGERIRKVSDDELQVLGGSYTTCDLPDPHYHFASRRMKIYLKDKLVAEPVVFYIKNVPLLALPFWIFPIKPGRHSGLLLPQFQLGFNNKAGRFFRNAGYYWAPNDYMDLTVDGDYYQAEPSWVMRAEGNYKLLYVLDGSFTSSYARDELLKTTEWDLNAEHDQELSPRTRLTARASFVSSRDYNSSDLFGRPISQRLNRFLTSNLAITHTADWASINAVLDRRQDLDADQSLMDPDGEGPLQGPAPGTKASLPNLTESLPSLSVSFPTRTIGTLPFLKGSPFGKALESLYLGMSSRYVAYRERRAFVVAPYDTFTNVNGEPDSTTHLGQAVTTRRGFQTDASLTDSRKVFGWISLQPSVNGSAAVFDFDELGHRVVPTGVWSASLASSASLYGTFHPNLGPLTGVRHVLVPRVAFTYSPEFPNLFFRDSTGLRNRFNSFAGIGVSGFRREQLDFGLDQRLQVKWGHGDKVRKLDNLASLSLGGSYNFLYREQGQLHPLSPITATLFVQPPGLFSTSATALFDAYSQRPLRTLTYNTGLNLVSHGRRASSAPDLPLSTSTVTAPYGEDLEELSNAWNVGLTYSYAGGYTIGPNWASNQTANVVLRMRATPNWNFDYSTSYDVTHHQFGIQQFSITRDLHCWVATFSRTFAPGGEAEYYFRIAVKDQRELYLERGNRTGSLGGIQ